MTTAPRATAGRISAAACSARAAAKSRASVRAAIPWLPGPEQDLADRLADRGAAGLAGDHDLEPAGPQGIGEQAALGGLARPFTALEDHERPGHGPNDTGGVRQGHAASPPSRSRESAGRRHQPTLVVRALSRNAHGRPYPEPARHGRGWSHDAGTGASGESRS